MEESPETWQQEQISLAYLSAVATRAGATSATWNVDKDGVDVTLKRNHIFVEFQMKCTFAPTILADGETYAFDLDMRTYDELRVSTRAAAGYLGLVVVSRDMNSWLVHNEELLFMHCSGYYAKVQNLPPASGKYKRIHLPKKQRIDQAGMNDVFTYAYERLWGSPTSADTGASA
ncbi:DUF4365 domain-containing protein [Streptomyces sp. NBC_00669]|uniref:DUF4365 domain-containing protein n=1 Tax=Streptomyces sp. NBC_00669 TaxID=2976011 RepID=UPI002E374A2F|nr:DUF4365 domain-containing protein [Streptomyces sp. NBC_00669]